MERLRPIFLTAAILAILAAISLLFSGGRDAATDPRVGEPVAGLGTFQAAAVITISGDDTSLHLTRGPDGGWSLLEMPEVPVNTPRLEELASALVGVRVDRLVHGDSEALLAEAGPLRHLQISDPAGVYLLDLELGAARNDGSVPARLGAGSPWYLLERDIRVPATIREWAVLSAEPEDAAGAPAVGAEEVEIRSSPFPEEG